MATAVDQIATAFPREAFAILDVDVKTLAHRPANVEGLLFREQEAGYLAGYAGRALGGQAQRHGSRLRGRARHPARRARAGRLSVRREAGASGAESADRILRRLRSARKCEHEALGQIAKGSVVEFQAAGPCGVGVLDAVKAKGIVGIGLGADESSPARYVLMSAVERADVAVEAAVRLPRTGQPAGGTK